MSKWNISNCEKSESYGSIHNLPEALQKKVEGNVQYFITSKL
jgi:hypothetical protein